MYDEQFNQWLAKFKQFLIDNDATVYWQYTNEDRLRSMGHIAYWLSSQFDWGRSIEGYEYWNRLFNLWDEITNK